MDGRTDRAQPRSPFFDAASDRRRVCYIAAGDTFCALSMEPCGTRGNTSRAATLNEPTIFAGIELGGTKLLCRAVDAEGRVLVDQRFATTSPAQAMRDIGDCLDKVLANGRRFSGIGIATFGPITLDPNAPGYGHLLTTPKHGWSGFDLLGEVRRRFNAPVAIDTDVNAAALAEQKNGAGRGFGCVAYVTVGTGIGGGLSCEGKILHGSMHPEIGHIRLRRRESDNVASACPFHDDCAEGLASGAAIAKRLGPSESLADSSTMLALIAEYLGELLATLTLAWSPHCIVLGGGVSKTAGIHNLIAEAMQRALGDYGPAAAARSDFIVAPHFADSGLEGALLMARAAHLSS